VTRAELTAALEKATGASRELDAEIAKLVGAPHGPYEHVTVETRSIEYWNEQAPAYTGNLDAAMTLKPKHCALELRCTIAYSCGATVYGQDTHGDANGATPALALCIACIKALESGE
jgi:hypothetical protein